MEKSTGGLFAPEEGIWEEVEGDDGGCGSGCDPASSKDASSISQSEALAHGLTHLHFLRGASVRAVELDGIAALQDAVEYAFPSLVAGRVIDAPWVEIRGDDHGLARLVTSVDDGVDVLHHVARVALRTQVLDEKQVVGEDAVEVALTLLKRGFHEVHDIADIRLERGEPEVDEPVRYRRGHEGLAGADISEKQQAIGVLRVERRRIALAQRGGLRSLAVIRLESAVPVEAACRKALLAHPLRLLSALLGVLALFALLLLGLRAFAGDGHDARAPKRLAVQPHLLRGSALPADEKPVLVAMVSVSVLLRCWLDHIDPFQRLVQFLHVLPHPFFPQPMRAVLRAFYGFLAHLLAHGRQIAANPISLPCRHISTCRRSASPWRSCNRHRASP